MRAATSVLLPVFLRPRSAASFLSSGALYCFSSCIVRFSTSKAPPSPAASPMRWRLFFCLRSRSTFMTSSSESTSASPPRSLPLAPALCSPAPSSGRACMRFRRAMRSAFCVASPRTTSTDASRLSLLTPRFPKSFRCVLMSVFSTMSSMAWDALRSTNSSSAPVSSGVTSNFMSSCLSSASRSATILLMFSTPAPSSRLSSSSRSMLRYTLGLLAPAAPSSSLTGGATLFFLCSMSMSPGLAMRSMKREANWLTRMAGNPACSTRRRSSGRCRSLILYV
mmetsp:Transcript_19274/g.58290  ORF Transcript_19274/g.58290 Transcript_19274/m.58290 type:complete len:280 (+) Transcript_19274:359-1198(+)